MSVATDGRIVPTTGPRPAGYEPPRVETVLSAEDLEREVMTGQLNLVSGGPI